MSESGGPSPDPWAVVEHHARRVAAAGDSALDPGQRLAMYLAAAPQVVGARPMTSRERGMAKPGDVQWVVPSPDGTGMLAIDASGGLWVRTSSQARQVFAAAAAFVVGTALFTRLAGPRAIIAGLIIAAGAYLLTGVAFSRWRLVGSRPGDQRYAAMMNELVARYERAVPSVE